jgi:hypothetical protein
VIFLTFSLLLFCGLGIPVSLLLPKTIPDRLAAAPIFGLAIFAIVVTVAYMHGALTAATITLSVLAAAGLIGGCFASERGWLAALLVAGLTVGAICLAPLWIGGWQFAIYQGNPTDQFNYFSMASAYSSRSYADLVAAGQSSDLTYLRLAASELYARPAVTIVLAALRPWFYATTAEASYPYLALLQTISLFGVLFAVRNIFGASRVAGLVIATAFAVGFFPQYVSDINAWSSLSALGFAPACLALVFLVATGAGGAAAILPLALTAAGVLYLYPESAPVCAISCLIVFVGCLISTSNGRWLRTLYVGLSVAVALLACAPAWQSTAAFLILQIGPAKSAPWSWFVAYDSFYFSGIDHAVLIKPTMTGVISILVNAVSGLFGVYFIYPPQALPPSILLLWKLCDAAFFAGLVGAAVYAINKKSTAIAVVSLMACLALPFYMAAEGNYWAAGKAISMASPFVFLALTYPITTRSSIAVPAALLVALHLGFGAQRIFAATDESAIRAANGYPGVPHLKALYDWRLDRWSSELAGCRLVAVTVKDGLLQRAIETFLSDSGIRSEFLISRFSYYYEGDPIPAQLASHRADCTIVDQDEPGITGRIINLSNAVSSTLRTSAKIN